jgi:D-apiose dehydrogenase
MQTPKPTLNIACVGTGYFSHFHYEAWSRIEKATLVGLYNRNLENAQEFAKKYHIPVVESDFEQLLIKTKPDIVDIITPPQTHLAYVTLAAKHGVNVICQKPFGETLADAEAMVALAEKANITLVVHENFRFMPWYRAIKTLLDSGQCGDILDVNFYLRPGDGQGPTAYLARQPYFQTMEKFLVHETAIHLVDTFRYLFGEVRSVYADLRRCNSAIKGEDSGIIVFSFDNNLRAIFNGNRLLDHAASNTRRTMGELFIEGTKAIIRLDGEAKIWIRKFGETQEHEKNYPWHDKNFGGDCVFHCIEHIVEHFTKEALLENTGHDYLENIYIENAIYQSASEKRQISTGKLT